MRKRRLILAILALGILAALIFTFTRTREPSYKGIPLSKWLDRLSEFEPDEATPQAYETREAIRHIGTNAIPSLLNWILPAKEGSFESQLQRLATRLPPRLRPKWVSIYSRPYRAGTAFSILGPQARSAVPQLVRWASDTNDTDTAYFAMLALARMGNDGLRPVMALLSNQNRTIRLQATRLISYQGTNAGPAVPALISILYDPDKSFHDAALCTLFRIDQVAAAKAYRQYCLDDLINGFAKIEAGIKADAEYRSNEIRKLEAALEGDAESRSNRLLDLEAIRKANEQDLSNDVRKLRIDATNLIRLIPDLLTNAPPK